MIGFGIFGWGALVGLDSTSFPQIMVSRPLVAGAGAGLILGAPLEGATVGALLELLALTVLPIGAARNPEAGTAAVAAAAAYVEVVPRGLDPVALLLAVAVGLAWEHVGGRSVHLLRRANERIAPDPLRVASSPEGEVERRHLSAMLLDLLRGGVVAWTGAVGGAWILGLARSIWPFDPLVAGAAIVAATALALGAALRMLDGWAAHRVALAIGVLCGLAVLWMS